MVSITGRRFECSWWTKSGLGHGNTTNLLFRTSPYGGRVFDFPLHDLYIGFIQFGIVNYETEMK